MVNRKWKTIYYIYPNELGEPPVQWDLLFDDVNVQYITDIPDVKFFDTAERNSLIVIDDLWTESTENADIVKCFKVSYITHTHTLYYDKYLSKVFSRKMGISVIIVSQSFFSGGAGGREIRNNW